MVVPFLRLGLENKEACLWVISDTIGVLEAVRALQRECDLAPFIDSGQLLILPAEKWYLNRGRFSEKRALEKWEKFIGERHQRGFRSFRGVGDTGWLEMTDWFKFQSYEEKTHEWLQDFTMTVICAYPIQRCSLTQTKDILAHHDGVFRTKL